MNKSELVNAIANGAAVTKVEAGKVLDVIMSTITETLKNGEKVVLPGFGTFSADNRAARTGRNPQTGETIEIKASRAPKFKAGKTLKDAVQSDA